MSYQKFIPTHDLYRKFVRAVFGSSELYPRDERNFRSYCVRNHLEGFYAPKNSVPLVKLPPIPNLSDARWDKTFYLMDHSTAITVSFYAVYRQ